MQRGRWCMHAWMFYIICTQHTCITMFDEFVCMCANTFNSYLSYAEPTAISPTCDTLQCHSQCVRNEPAIHSLHKHHYSWSTTWSCVLHTGHPCQCTRTWYSENNMWVYYVCAVCTVAGVLVIISYIAVIVVMRTLVPATTSASTKSSHIQGVFFRYHEHFRLEPVIIM